MWKFAFFIDFWEKCYFEMVHQGETVKIIANLNSELQVLKTEV